MIPNAGIVLLYHVFIERSSVLSMDVMNTSGPCSPTMSFSMTFLELKRLRGDRAENRGVITYNLLVEGFQVCYDKAVSSPNMRPMKICLLRIILPSSKK